MKKKCSVYIQCKGDIVVVDIKQHKSQFKNSNITITQCQKNFADCVMVKFEQPRCHLYTVYKLNSFLHKLEILNHFWLFAKLSRRTCL